MDSRIHCSDVNGTSAISGQSGVWTELSNGYKDTLRFLQTVRRCNQAVPGSNYELRTYELLIEELLVYNDYNRIHLFIYNVANI